MNTNITTIMNMLDQMSVEELKNRLAAYMLADESLMPKPIGVEVRQTENFAEKSFFALAVPKGSTRSSQALPPNPYALTL